MGSNLEPGVGNLFVPLDFRHAGLDARKAWFRSVVADWNLREVFRPFEMLKASGRRTIISSEFYKELRKPGAVAEFIWNSLSVEESNASWTILSSGYCPSSKIDFRGLLSSPKGAEIEGLTEYFLHAEALAPSANGTARAAPSPSRLASVSSAAL